VFGSQIIVVSTVATLRARHPRNLVSILACLVFRAALGFPVPPAFCLVQRPGKEAVLSRPTLRKFKSLEL